MNRLWAAAAILVLLVGLCFTGIRTTGRIANDMTETLSQISEAMEQDDQEAAASLVRDATDRWQGYHTILCTYIIHDSLTSIDDSLAMLPAMISNGQRGDVTAECGKAISQVRHLMETELPYLQNIL